MCLLFIGNKKELFASYFELNQANTFIFATSATKASKFSPLSHEVDAIFFDLNNLNKNVKASYNLIRETFPEAKIYGLFDSKSDALKQELIDTGFYKVINYSEGIEYLLVQ